MMLLNDRWPPKEICVISNSVNVVPMPVRPVATPGVNRAKSREQAPLTGRSDLSGINALLISVRVCFHSRRFGGHVTPHLSSNLQRDIDIGVCPTD